MTPDEENALVSMARPLGATNASRDAIRLAIRAAYAQGREDAARALNKKLWLWKNFVDGRPEYWAFDNAFPINLDNYDPQTLGEPCGYALFKPSRPGRCNVGDEEVLRRIAAAIRRGDD